MLLRESSKAISLDIEAQVTFGDRGTDSVEHSVQLIDYAEAVTYGTDNVLSSGKALRSSLGDAGFVEAAAIVGIFNGLVRTADATGIPLDEQMKLATVNERASLGINQFKGASNTL